MSSIDFTTLYSAEAAIALGPDEVFDPINKWFVLALANTTSSLLFDSTLQIFVPPSAIETRRRLPRFVPFLEKHLPNLVHNVEPPEQDREAALALVTDFCSTDEVFGLLKVLASDYEYWSNPHVAAWLKWHKENELESHQGVLDGEIGSVEFEPIIKRLGIQNMLLHFAMDAIVRGLYYYTLVPNDLWLHPVRIERMPLREDRASSTRIRVDGDLLAFVIGVLELQKQTSIGDHRQEQFASTIRTVRAIIGDPTKSLSDETRGDLGREFGLAWTAPIVEQIFKVLGKVVPMSSTWSGVMAETGAQKIASGMLQSVALYYPRIESWAGSKARQVDKKRIARVTTTGKRILSIAG